jgi:hypothetical protein
MFNFTREQKAQAFDSLPKEAKSALTSNSIYDAYKRIAQENGLSIEKMGALSEVVTLTIMSLLPREELVGNLEKALGINNARAVTLATSINNLIFLKLREIMQEEMRRSELETEDEQVKPSSSVSIDSASAPSPTPQKPAQEEPTSSREDILAGIENPEPAIHPISAVDQTIPGPAMRAEITPADKATATSFITGKLTETMTQPPQKAVFEVEQKKAPEKPKNYSADPYREPIS